jgi:hypothetical protein
MSCLAFKRVTKLNESSSLIYPLINYEQPAIRIENPSVNKPPTTNPFDDSFSPLNDNEIFGIEFDRIRHKPIPGNYLLSF